MPPLSTTSHTASVLIPVLPLPNPPPYSPPRRTYPSHALPIHTSTAAPRNARIINRVIDRGVPTFHIRIGDTDIPGIELDEILEYVSAYELEQYENAQFAVEGDMWRLADEEDERIERERYERAGYKGVVRQVTQSESESESQSEEEEEEGEGKGTGMVGGEDVEVGKHGRARPSYKGLFKQVRQRRLRRKRDPVTGELVDLSDREEDERMGVELASSDDDDDERVAGPSSGAVKGAVGEKKKRRRRRRDPVTGELLPLPPLAAGQVDASHGSSSEEREIEAPASKPAGLHSFSLGEKAKRPRRRRHPITLELMPLGWRYDPDEDTKFSSTPRAAITVPTGLHRLSISQEHEPKRRRLDDSSAGRTRSRSPAIAVPVSQVTIPKTQNTMRGSPPPKPSTKINKGKGRARDFVPLAAFSGGVIDLASSSNDDEENLSSEAETKVEPKPKPKILRRTMGGTATITQPSSRSIGSETSSAAAESPQSQPPRPQGQPPDTTKPRLISPVKPRAPSRSPSPSGDDDDDNSEVSSASDHIVPLALPSSPAPATTPKRSQPLTSITHPNPPPSHSPSNQSSPPASEKENDEYPIEAILSHHLSDPRTHPAELGREPVMLYRVKWEGFADPTWEPMSSFGDAGELGGGVVGAYRRGVGLD